jgi:hypothetical protein
MRTRYRGFNPNIYTPCSQETRHNPNRLSQQRKTGDTKQIFPEAGINSSHMEHKEWLWEVLIITVL